MKLFLLLTGLVSAHAWASSIYNITDLGTLGGNSSMAYALNDAGQAAGTATNPFGNMNAMNFGGALSLSAGASESSAWGVNNANQISGTQYINGVAYATVWNNGAPELLAGANSYGTGINQSGDAAGMLVSRGQGEAFVMINGIVQVLGSPDGCFWSSAYSINGADQAAGYAQTWGGMRAFVWSPDSGYLTLGTLGGANSYAMAINDSGEVAGHAQTSSGYLHAALWNGSSIQDLGTLDGGNSYAYGIDAAGDVVGASGDHAFLYQDGVMLDLNSLLTAGPGWTLTQAYAINASGQIAGAGLFNGVEHAFLLNPTEPQPPPTASSLFFASPEYSVTTPEPSSWTLILAGLALGLVPFRAAMRKHAAVQSSPVPRHYMLTRSRLLTPHHPRATMEVSHETSELHHHPGT
ncbi:MAG TPA: PEP-CTERM sorting domain-containing protein [Bryobacteraceae bacterium]|jgi:probable HAF family extracellular repeat protein